MHALLPEMTLLPVSDPSPNGLRKATKARKHAPTKVRVAPKAAARPAALAATLETRWRAALAAHQRKVEQDFAALHKAIAGRKAKDAKLERILDQEPKASGRIKDVRRAERALKDALARLAR
jgi:hypothetical protein